MAGKFQQEIFFGVEGTCPKVMPHTNFLTLEQVLAIHDDQIERYGGSHGIRDLGLLEAAIARPQSSFGGEDLYPDTFLKAGVYMHGIIMNHAFVDGNKRTGSVSMARFLFINGYNLVVSQKDLVATTRKIEAKKISIKELTLWIRKNSKRIK